MGSELYVNKVLKWREQGLSPGGKEKPYWKSISEQDRKNATKHCGPENSYPLGPDCAHVKSAWTLAMAGHGSPNLGCIKSYAQQHGCYVPPAQKALEWLKYF